MQPKTKQEQQQEQPQQPTAAEAVAVKSKGSHRPRVKYPKESSSESPSSSGNRNENEPTSSQSAEKKVKKPKEQVENQPRKQITAEDVKRYQSYVGQKWTGKCKWFNVTKGFGFIVPDHEEAIAHNDDVFVHQSALQMEGFRSLGEGEEVEFTVKVKTGDEGGGGLEAGNVQGKNGAPIKGHDIRPMGRKVPRDQTVRCYNCGRIGRHKASGCKEKPALTSSSTGEMTKLCYHCHEKGHLLANCPKYRREKNRQHRSEQKDSGNSNGAENTLREQEKTVQ